jgi:RNA polymerase sigma-70 factor (ECF subfamily)
MRDERRTLGGGAERHSPADLDEETLVRWVREHGSSIRGYVRSLLRDPTLAEDLVQEVFFRAWRQREGYVERGTEKAYLFRIADRLVIDHWRGRPMDGLDEQCPPIDPGARSPLEEVVLRESHDRLTRALTSLTEAQRRVLLLRYFGDLRFEEIASMVGCPLGTALSHARRGLESLRVFFAQHEPITREEQP